MKVLDAIWFNKVGIVRVEDEYDGIKYYVKDVDGLNEEDDMWNIAYWGSTFPKNAGDVLFGVK